MLILLMFESLTDKDKFEAVYNKYGRLMLHKAYEILRDYRLSEDAASEAFIRIYKNIGKIGDPESNMTASFVVTIVKNTALTMLAREKRKRTVSLYDVAEEAARPGDIDLEEDVISRLSSARVYELLNTLSENLRSVFLLKFAHDLSSKQIGHMLGMTENSVNVQLHRAKKKIAELLREEGREYA